MRVCTLGNIRSSTISIKEHLNILRSHFTERRDEEIFKYLMKRILRYIHKTKLFGIDDPLTTFYNEYFSEFMKKNEFNSLFSLTKE